MTTSSGYTPSVTTLNRKVNWNGSISAPLAYVAGKRGTGKSTLLEVLMKEYQLAYSKEKLPVRTLIIDTKPRFKAESELYGVKTSVSRRYRKWGYGSEIIPGSFALPQRGSIKSNLDQIWRLGGTVAIASTERELEWGWASEAARVFYEGYGSKHPRLLFVDELSDFFVNRSLSDIFQRVARNGRERDCAFIAGSQRPRKIPVEIMSEMSRVYLFHIDYSEDVKNILRYGVPQDTIIPSMGHTFFMYDHELGDAPPSKGYYELDLSTNYHTGEKMNA